MVLGEVPKKRKAPGSQQGGSVTGEQRLRSPPILTYSSTSGDLAAGRRGHKRQRSDMSWRHASPGQGEWREQRETRRKSLSPHRESTYSTGRAVVKGEGGGHSVSSLLSAEPELGDHYRQQQNAVQQLRQHEQESHRTAPPYGRYFSEGHEDPRRTPPPNVPRGDGEASQHERPE